MREDRGGLITTSPYFSLDYSIVFLPLQSFTMRVSKECCFGTCVLPLLTTSKSLLWVVCKKEKYKEKSGSPQSLSD